MTKQWNLTEQYSCHVVNISSKNYSFCLSFILKKLKTHIVHFHRIIMNPAICAVFVIPAPPSHCCEIHLKAHGLSVSTRCAYQYFCFQKCTLYHHPM